MAPAAWDRSSQGGVKNRRPGVQKRKPRGLNFAPRGSNFVPRGVPNGLLDSSWGVLGARSACGGRSGRQRGSWKIVWRALGTDLGLSWRVVGPFWVDFLPRGGGEIISKFFWGLPGREAKTELFFFFEQSKVFSPLFLCYIWCSVAFLAAWPAPPRTCKNLEKTLVFVGRKPHVPFSRSARSKQISEGMRSKHRWKMSSTKESTGSGTT